MVSSTETSGVACTCRSEHGKLSEKNAKGFFNAVECCLRREKKNVAFCCVKCFGVNKGPFKCSAWPLKKLATQWE